MRSFLHIALSVYLLAISAGVPIYRHFCMGELRDSSVVVSELKEISCCGAEDKKSDCCDHEVSLEKTHDQKVASFAFQLPPATVVASIDHFTFYPPLAITGIEEGYPADTSPPRPGASLSVWFQNFRC